MNRNISTHLFDPLLSTLASGGDYYDTYEYYYYTKHKVAIKLKNDFTASLIEDESDGIAVVPEQV